MQQNVDADGLKAYIEAFHDKYLELVEANVSADMRHYLDRYQRLPCKTIGYVSTQYGAGFEYVSGDQEITVEVGSQRIEELFCKAPNRVRKLPVFIIVGGHNGLEGLTLDGGFPFRFSPDANGPMRIVDVRFTALGWTRLVEYAEIFPSRLANDWTISKAHKAAEDELLAVLGDIRTMERENVSVSEFLTHQKQRSVIVAGDYSAEGRTRLNKISRELHRLGYTPRLLSDVPDVFEYDLPEKFAVLATMARFVVFDDSSMSGHIRELTYAAQQGLVTIILRQDGASSSYMTRGDSIKSTVLREYTYGADAVAGPLLEATQWAEERVKELGREHTDLYPWRKAEGETEENV